MVTAEDIDNLQKGDESNTCPQPNSVPNENYYKVSSSYKRTILSEKKLEELKTAYSNYQNLKTALKIPDANNFDFKVVFSSGSPIEATRNIPDGVEINAINKRMEVLRKTGEIEFADILVRMW